jgi:hypothetical protein
VSFLSLRLGSQCGDNLPFLTTQSKKSVLLVHINGINQFFEPEWAKNYYQQTYGTGNWKRANTENHEHNKDDGAFDSGFTRN